MEISARKKLILKAVVEDHIETAEPVGSKALMGRLGLGVSSATIRSEMGDLEQMGLLVQPHTSAGRVPTVAGYRLYVNELMGSGALSGEETAVIAQNLKQPTAKVDQLVSDASKLTSQLTALPSWTNLSAPGEVVVSRFELVYIDSNSFIIVALLSNRRVQNRLVALPVTIDRGTLVKFSALFNAGFTHKPECEITPELIAATERAAGDTQGLTAVIAGFVIETLMQTKAQSTFVSGATQLLGQPEFQDVERARDVLGYLGSGQALQDLPMPIADGVEIIIGPENVARELRDLSVVAAKYDAGDNMQGILGVVGPTRMDYSRIAARLSYIAEHLAQALNMGTALTQGDQGDRGYEQHEQES